MAKKAIKRTPVKREKPVRIRRDSLKEYRERISKDGIVEVLTLEDDDASVNVRRFFSTGSIALDRLLPGGFPAGRITEILGPNHIGKSTLLDHVFAGSQRAGGEAVLADCETSRNRDYTARLGVDLARLQILQFDTNKQSMENVLQSIFDTISFWASEYPDTPVVIGWDSLGGTPTNEELSKTLGDATMASAAKVMRKTCRQVLHHLAGTNIAFIVLNHFYKKVQGKGGNESYGGEAIRLAASVRLELHPTEGQWITRADGAVVGRRVGVRLLKSRFGNSYGTTEIALLNDVGIDNTWTIYEEFKARGLMAVSGSWGAINVDGDEVKFQGWNGFQQKLAEHPELFQKLVAIFQTIPR